MANFKKFAEVIATDPKKDEFGIPKPKELKEIDDTKPNNLIHFNCGCRLSLKEYFPCQVHFISISRMLSKDNEIPYVNLMKRLIGHEGQEDIPPEIIEEQIIKQSETEIPEGLEIVESESPPEQ